MRCSEAAWDELISDLYLSALDAGARARLPARLTALTGGTIASVWELRPSDCAVLGTLNTTAPAEAIEAYSAHYYQHDPWQSAVQGARFGTLLQGAEMIDSSTLLSSTYYNEFGAEHGMFHLVGAIVPVGRGPGMTVGALTILCPHETEGFDADALAAAKRLLPHLPGAFRLRAQLAAQLAETIAATELASVEALLAALGKPALIVDGHGTVLHANALALALSPVRDALSRRLDPNRRLPMPAGAPRDRWTRLVAAAARGEAGGAVLRPGEPDLLLTVSPLPLGLAALTGAAGGRVLVLLRERDAPVSSARLAVAAFGLTEAEAAVAAALAAGDSPAEIATARGVKISTVRTLLARVQDKTDSRNLRDVVRILLSLAL